MFPRGAYKALRLERSAVIMSAVRFSQSVIEHNRNRYPEARWPTSSAYRLPLRDDSVDACFSMYVLDHLVCPEKILDEMLRVTKKGGHAILLFPDFLRPGRFVSQQAGFGFGTAKEKLKQGTLPDTVVTCV
jgi:ubiquinone/menaquinone biosynthesis C-methylase UbiE